MHSLYGVQEPLYFFVRSLVLVMLLRGCRVPEPATTIGQICKQMICDTHRSQVTLATSHHTALRSPGTYTGPGSGVQWSEYVHRDWCGCDVNEEGDVD